MAALPAFPVVVSPRGPRGQNVNRIKAACNTVHNSIPKLDTNGFPMSARMGFSFMTFTVATKADIQGVFKTGATGTGTSLP